MKIYYIANICLPTPKAHGRQIMKTCEALAKGNEIELIVTNRRASVKEELFQYYGIKSIFSVKKLWCLDTVRAGWLGFWIELATFTVSLSRYVAFRSDFFYTRDEFIAFWLKLLGKKVVWEAHMGQKNMFVKFLVKNRVPIVVISQGLKNLYLTMGLAAEKILVAHDGVDLDFFRVAVSKAEARMKLGLRSDQKIILYQGSRGYLWKGTTTLEMASKFLPPNFKILILTDKPHHEIPIFLAAADVLVLPNSGKNEVSKLYTSPMKLFEYMTSRRPIIASNLPSLREILDDSSAYFFEADSEEELAKRIMYVLSHETEASQKALMAFEKVREFTWEERAKKIGSFIRTELIK